MFAKIMRTPSICKSVLETILNIKIKQIEYLETEKIIDITKYSKSIRLDVYVEDEFNTIYNIEMQVEKSHNIPRRSRYYHDLIDLNTLEKGYDYDTLKESYVIFICLFDLFEQGNYIYTFENRCTEIPELTLNDGRKTIFVNASGIKGNISNELKQFLEYVSGSRPNNELTNNIDSMVNQAKYNFDWRQEYMSLDLLIREQIVAETRIAKEKALEEGRKEGIAEGRKEGIAEGRKEGKAEGRLEGKTEGIQMSSAVIKLFTKGYSAEDISKELSFSLEDVILIIEQYNK